MVVGAFGPWELGNAESERWLRNAFRSWLARWDVSLGYTDLEPGTGILFGEVLAEAVIPFRVLLPTGKILAPICVLPKFELVRRQAVAAHVLDDADGLDWQLVRMHLAEQCDVVLSVLSGDAEADAEFIALQVATCQARKAVVSLNLSTKAAQVVCKNDPL